MKRILIVDDNLSLSALLRDALSNEGFSCTVETDPTNALESVRVHRPHLIILDALMPGKSGQELLNEMRLTEGFESIPVVLQAPASHHFPEKKSPRNCQIVKKSDHFPVLLHTVRELLETAKGGIFDQSDNEHDPLFSPLNTTPDEIQLSPTRNT